jgi:general stress protein 26
MLAGGMVIAAPSMVPEAAAAGSLYVSAENAMFDNTFGGAQIIEVIVLDPNRSRTDISQGEPVVKVDENQLRMAQGVDGNWYGYFGDEAKVEAANTFNNNLTFGTNDSKATASAALNYGDFNEATDVIIATNVGGASGIPNGMTGTVSNAPVLSAWNGTGVGSVDLGGSGAAVNGTQGQIGIISENTWPIIQLYTLTSSTGTYNFDVVYEQAGANEVVSLTYTSDDLDDYSSLTLDRNSASQESDVHLTITDNQLNIDPTAEDIVIFDTTTGSEDVSFTERDAGDSYQAWSNSFDENGKLVIDYDANSIGTDVFVETATDDDTSNDKYMVFFEYGENSGIFVNTDDNNESNLEVNIDAKRGTTATFTYNDSAQSFVVANDFGTIDMDAASVGDEWNSGEEITVTLIDQDLNKNTLVDEDLVMANATAGHLVPSLQIGSPLMTNAIDSAVISNSSYSNIAWYNSD